jgi:hypothetical protein
VGCVVLSLKIRGMLLEADHCCLKLTSCLLMNRLDSSEFRSLPAYIKSTWSHPHAIWSQTSATNISKQRLGAISSSCLLHRYPTTSSSLSSGYAKAVPFATSSAGTVLTGIDRL